MMEFYEALDYIDQQLDEAEDYAREAVKDKEHYPEYATIYSKIAADAHAHAEMLCKHIDAKVSEHVSKGTEHAGKMRNVWEYAKRKAHKRMGDAKMLLEMYKG